MKATLGTYDSHKVVGGADGMVWSDLAHPSHWSFLLTSLSVDQTQIYSNGGKVAYIHPGTVGVGLFSNDFTAIKNLLEDDF